MGFEIPEDITALDDAALAEAVEAALAEGAALAETPDDDLTDEQVERLDALAAFVQEARAAQDERTEAASARSERLAAARDAFTAKDEDEGDDNEGEDGDESADSAATPDEPVEEETPEPVQKAAVKRNVTTRAARRAPKEETTARRTATLTAAADVPGFSTGQSLEGVSDVAKAVQARLRGMHSLAGRKGVFSKNGVATIAKAHNGVVLSQANRDFESDAALLNAAGRESRLTGGSLVAAGGWGAPSETVLDFCDPGTTAEGIIDVPEVTITRGGVNYTKGPSFGDVFDSSTGFIDQTEAQAEAGEEKTALRPEVPGFTEVRLEAVGVFVEAGILLNATWPELVEQYVEYALLANQHKVGRKVLSKIRGLIGDAVDLTGGAGNVLDVLHLIEMVIVGERERNLLGFNTTMEVLLPHWVKAVFRADLANRNGVDMLSVSDAQIDAFFAARKARVQYLYDQPLERNAAGIVTHYPDTVEAVIYPAGSYVKGTSDVITLDTVYDSTNLRKNDFVRLFTEEGVLVTNPCGDGRRVNIPLTISGRSSAADIVGPYLTAAGEPTP